MRKLLFAVLTLALSVAPFVASAQSKDMTREEWLKIENPDARHVAYINMSSDAKVSFWKDKFKDVKELKWSKAERKHIESSKNSTSAILTNSFQRTKRYEPKPWRCWTSSRTNGQRLLKKNSAGRGRLCSTLLLTVESSPTRCSPNFANRRQ